MTNHSPSVPPSQPLTADALFTEGRRYWRGQVETGAPPHPQDIPHGLGLLHAAADRGHIPALKLLGYILAHGGEGAEQDLEAAGRCYSRARELGDSDVTIIYTIATWDLTPKQQLDFVDGLRHRGTTQFQIAVSRPHPAP